MKAMSDFPPDYLPGEHPAEIDNVRPFPREAPKPNGQHQPTAKLLAPLWISQQDWTEDEIPARPWVAPGYLLRGAVTVLAGPGSAGKSSLMVAWATSLAYGVKVNRLVPVAACRVATYNVEDDLSEQRRRFSAYLRQIQRSPKSLMLNLAIIGPAEGSTLLTINQDGSRAINTAAMDALDEFCANFKPDVLMLDPFGELHSAEENDNTTIRMIMSRFRQMAATHNMAILLAHHARKGGNTPGDPDSMRGASSIVNAARIAMTLNVMTEDEATNLGISTDSRRNYFRLDGAKSNYAPLESAEWFQRAEYTLDNEDRTIAVIPWQPPIAAATPELIERLTKSVALGTIEGPWSPRIGKENRSFAAALRAAGVNGAIAQKASMEALLAAGNVHIAKFRKPGKAATDAVAGLRTKDGEPPADWTN